MIRMLRPNAATSPVAIISPIAIVSPSKIGISKNSGCWSFANTLLPMSKIPAVMVKKMERVRVATMRMARHVIAQLVKLLLRFLSITISVSCERNCQRSYRASTTCYTAVSSIAMLALVFLCHIYGWVGLIINQKCCILACSLWGL